MFLNDMSGRNPLYKKYVWININRHLNLLLCTISILFLSLIDCWSCCRAYVFFSSPIQKELVTQIKKDSSVLPRIGALSEVTWIMLSSYILFQNVLNIKDCYANYLFTFYFSLYSRWIWSTLLLIPRYHGTSVFFSCGNFSVSFIVCICYIYSWSINNFMQFFIGIVLFIHDLRIGLSIWAIEPWYFALQLEKFSCN